MNTTNTNTTPAQARLLGVLRSDGRIWSIEELAERLAAEVELGSQTPTGAVAEAVDQLVAAKLAHRVGKGLVTASWRGMRGKTAGVGTMLQLDEDAAQIGVFAAARDDAELAGGAEGLSGRLDTVTARTRGA